MKIYCIKIDSMPFNDDVHRINEAVGGHLMRQVGGCYTTETLIQMLTGKHSSQLFNHGFGYRRWEDYCSDLNDRDQVTGKRFKGAIPKYDWVNESLPYILHWQGWKFKVLNELNVGVPLGFMRYDWYEETRIKDNEIDKHKQYVENIQHSDDNIFCMAQCLLMHDACDRSSSKEDLQRRQKECMPKVLELLSHWDFTEPNAIFWIYSDHGPYRFPECGAYPNVHNFVTWVLLQNNYGSVRGLPKSKIISATDFKNYVLRSAWDRHKVFFTEDGRLGIDRKKSTTAIACELVGKFFHSTVYHKPDNEFVAKEFELLDDLNLVQKTKFIYKVSGLTRELKQHFDWVK